MGTYLRVQSESYPLNTNMTGFGLLFLSLCSCALDGSILCIGRINLFLYVPKAACMVFARVRPVVRPITDAEQAPLI